MCPPAPLKEEDRSWPQSLGLETGLQTGLPSLDTSLSGPWVPCQDVSLSGREGGQDGTVSMTHYSLHKEPGGVHGVVSVLTDEGQVP